MSTNLKNWFRSVQYFPEIFGGKTQFLPIVPKVAICYLVIFRVTGLNVIKFVHNIQQEAPWAKERFCSRGARAHYTKYITIQNIRYTWGLGQSPSRQTIWCILGLKSNIWWQQF